MKTLFTLTFCLLLTTTTLAADEPLTDITGYNDLVLRQHYKSSSKSVRDGNTLAYVSEDLLELPNGDMKVFKIITTANDNIGMIVLYFATDTRSPQKPITNAVRDLRELLLEKYDQRLVTDNEFYSNVEGILILEDEDGDRIMLSWEHQQVFLAYYTEDFADFLDVRTENKRKKASERL